MLQVDLIRTVTLPHLQPFGIETGLELRVRPQYSSLAVTDDVLQIKRRGAAPLGGGQVQFLCPVIKQAKTLNFVEPGRIKRIRGIACVLWNPCLRKAVRSRNSMLDATYSHAVRVSPQFSNRMIDACRSVLNRYIPDIYIYSDVYKGEESGKCVPSVLHRRLASDAHLLVRSPGYALSLLAESTTSALHSSEAISMPGSSPEDVALAAARALLVEVRRGGCVDRTHQCLVLLMMVLGSEDVGRVRIGEFSPRT